MVPGDTLLSPASTQGQLPSCQRVVVGVGFNFILTARRKQDPRSYILNFQAGPTGQEERVRLCTLAGASQGAWGWWHLPWHSSGSLAAGGKNKQIQ